MSDMKDRLKDRIRRPSVHEQLIEPVVQKPVNEEIQEPVQKRKKATFDLDATLHTRLKVFAANKGKPMVDILEEALRQYLNNEEQ